jgi:hypothetical protein
MLIITMRFPRGAGTETPFSTNWTLVASPRPGQTELYARRSSGRGAGSLKPTGATGTGLRGGLRGELSLTDEKRASDGGSDPLFAVVGSRDPALVQLSGDCPQAETLGS